MKPVELNLVSIGAVHVSTKRCEAVTDPSKEHVSRVALASRVSSNRFDFLGCLRMFLDVSGCLRIAPDCLGFVFIILS